MKSTAQLLVLLLLCFYSLCTCAQTIDTMPLDAYWKLIEPLKKNNSLSQHDWANFLAIEANKTYIDNQGFDAKYLEKLRQNIEYVYMPKYDSLLNARIVAINKDPASYWITYKVYVYKKYEQQLKEYEKQLLNPTYLDLMYKQAFSWLPKKLQKKDTSAHFYLLGIENDAIAGEGVIIATLWNLYNQDRINMGSTAGHEMHHNLRQPLAFKNVSEADAGILYLLGSILNEGSADMIDKVSNIKFENKIPSELRYKDFLLNQADSIVTVINKDLVLMANPKNSIFKTEKDYRQLIRWTSGHCPGYYMADIIVRNGYKRQMIENIQNPFQFIYLYNKAAIKDKQKPTLFSKIAIEYVQKLEKKYWVHR